MPTRRSPVTFALAGGTALTIGSPLSLGTATLQLISGPLRRASALRPRCPDGLVLNNTLGFLNSTVTLGGNGNPITFTRQRQHSAGSANVTTRSAMPSDSITLGGAITGPPR